ncbi:hypothetical protein CYMTET_13643, partial [Cymbomonas tetramitiformis]
MRAGVSHPLLGRRIRSSWTAGARSVPQCIVWGAGTGIGKTLISAGLCKEAASSESDGLLFFYKPVQTGFPTDSDARLVAALCGAQEAVGAHAARLLDADTAERVTGDALDDSVWLRHRRVVLTEYAWHTAVGPHSASQQEGHGVAASDLISSIQQRLGTFHTASCAAPSGTVLSLVETAGGVASP